MHFSAEEEEEEEEEVVVVVVVVVVSLLELATHSDRCAVTSRTTDSALSLARTLRCAVDGRWA